MKSSTFNKFITIDKENYIYNFLSNKLCILEKKVTDPSSWAKEFSKDEQRQLLNEGFLVYSVDKEINQLQNNYKIVQKQKDLIITLALTFSCNFACPYCYEKRSPDKISENKQKSLLSFLEQCFKKKKTKKLTLTWFGGEPLLCLNIITKLNTAIAELCEKYNILYTTFLTTNGYLINNLNIKQIKALKIKTIYISLDGAEKFHDSTRKPLNGEGSFRQIIVNLELLEANKMNYILRINTTRENSPFLRELLFELKELHSNLYLGHIQNYNDQLSDCEICLTKQEFAKLNLYFNKLRNYKGCIFPNKQVHCRAAKLNNFVLDPNLNIYQCENDLGRIDRSVGKILSNGNVNKSFNDYLKWNPFNYTKCRKCEILPICYGGCLFSGLKQNEPQCIMEKYIINSLLKAHILEVINDNKKQFI